MNNLKQKFHEYPIAIQEVLKFILCCFFVSGCFWFVIFTIYLAMINPILAGIEFCFVMGAIIYFSFK